MKIIHVIENIDERYGGPAQSVPCLCKYLSHYGVASEIHSVRRYPDESNLIVSENRIPWFNYENSITDAMRYSSGLAQGIARSINAGETILHTHNQWNYPPYCAYRSACRYQVPLICSIRGSLVSSDYRQIKRILWILFQKRMLRRAACLHITKAEDFEVIRSLGINTPVAFIPNGVETEGLSRSGSRDQALAALALPPSKRYLLFLSRIHPLKGVDALLQAWSAIAAANDKWELLIAGPCADAEYLKRLKKIAASPALAGRARFFGMLDREAKRNAYAAAELFVLPSRSENFGMAIAEALAAGLPVITTRNVPWREIEEKKCGRQIELTPDSLQAALQAAINLPEQELSEMGKRGRELIREKYSWELQAEKMQAVYRWLLAHGDRPPFVQV